MAVILCIGFHSEIQTFAENILFKSSVILGNKKINEKVERVIINDVAVEDLQKKYSTMEEVEELLGITLLKSEEAYVSPKPNISMTGWNSDGEAGGKADIVEICNMNYYVHDMEQDVTEHEGGEWFKYTGDNPYSISYQATLYDPLDSETSFEDSYSQAVFIEDYETANGLTASIFRFGGSESAIIYANNMQYEFTIETTIYKDREKKFKAFLDTLK